MLKGGAASLLAAMLLCTPPCAALRTGVGLVRHGDLGMPAAPCLRSQVVHCW
jgi:hypothetical protein